MHILKNKNYLLLLVCLAVFNPKICFGENSSKSQSYLANVISIHDVIVELLNSPTVDTYKKLLNLIAERLPQDVWEKERVLYDARDLLEEDKFKEAIELINGPGALHTFPVPMHHLILAGATRALGENEEADEHSRVAFMLLSLIAKTGDGSIDAPYHVLHVRAQRDFISYHQKKDMKERLRQELVQHNGRQIDVHTFRDGSKTCFDVTKRLEIYKKVPQRNDEKTTLDGK